MIKPKVKPYLFFSAIFLLSFNLFLKSSYIHQQGGDTWAVAVRVTTITQAGLVPWFLHPLSYYGWYPYSYPTGELLLISAVKNLTALEIQPLVYIFSTFVGIFGMLSMFIIARSFGFNFRFLVILVFIYSTFEWVFYISTNNISTRGLFVATYPLSVFLLFRIYNQSISRKSYILLLMILLPCLLSIHRIAVYYISLILLPFILTLILKYLSDKFNPEQKPNKYMPILILGFLFGSLLVQVLDILVIEPSLTSELDERIVEREYIPEDIPFSIFFSAAFFYYTRYNLSVILIPVGLIWLATKNFRTIELNFLLVLSICASFFILDIGYFLYFFVPLAVLLVGFGLKASKELFTAKKPMFLIPIILLVVLSSVFYLRWYVQKDYTLLIFLWIFGIIYLFKSIPLSKRNIHSRLFVNMIIGLLLMQTSFALSTSVYKSSEYLEQKENGSGPIFNEFQAYDNAYWLLHYAQEGWMATDANTRGKLWTLSSIPTPATYLYVGTEPLVPSMIAPQFNFTVLMQNQRVAFQYDIAVRYDPKSIDTSILVRNETDLIEKYGIDWFILPPGQVNIKEKEDVTGLVPYIRNNKFSIYENTSLIIYYY